MVVTRSSQRASCDPAPGCQMDALNLTVPLQHDYNDPTVERNIGRLQEWLINLPLMNVVETVRLVLGALSALNEQKLDDELRFRFLEVYRSTVLRLFQTLDPLHLRQLVLSRTQRQEAIENAARLFLELAGGYKVIVKARYPDTGSKTTDRLLGLAINRALELLGYSLLDGYRFYREIPALLFAESHLLYRSARRYGLLNVTVPSDDDAQPLLTTADIYHVSMLLSLTEPERLAEGEAGLLFDVLQRHAGGCRIIPGNSWEGTGEGLFLLDLHTGSLPVPCTTLRSRAQAAEPYLLDATGALQAIRKQLEHTPEKMRMQSPEATLLRRLMPEQSAELRRREQRRSDGRYAGILVGLEAVHAWLGNHREAGGNRTTGLMQCKVLDSSPNGMKLSWQEGGSGDVQVGELLGVVEGEGSRSTLQLAIVRSVRVYQEGGLETGVLLLSGGFGAVTCSIPDSPGPDEVHALFMPANESEQLSATLLAARGLYQHGCKLVIDVGGREIHVRAGRTVFESPLYDRFEFSAQ
jgi:cyclic-di-GMP-binding protein